MMEPDAEARRAAAAQWRGGPAQTHLAAAAAATGGGGPQKRKLPANHSPQVPGAAAAHGCEAIIDRALEAGRSGRGGRQGLLL